MLDSISSEVVRFVFHHTRLYGWVPTAAWMLKYRGGRYFILFYCAVRKSDMWRGLVHQFFRHGVKNSPARIENGLTVPLKPASEKRYMICLHPHGMLACGWHIAVAKEPKIFMKDTNDSGGIPNFKPFLCFSPVIQYVPAHQELFRERCGGASSKEVENILETTDCMPAICPGGFSEAMYCGDGGKYEYSWLKGNLRFMALAIKNKTDIIPNYTYGLTSMYRSQTFLRQQLAELAQKISFPLIFPWGKFLALPLHEDAVTVVYDPFSVQKYSLEDVGQALSDYQVYLKSCFDQDKGKYGMGDKELVFIGPRDVKGTPKQIQSKL